MIREKIMDVRVLTGLVCPAARPLRVRQYPGALKGCGVKTGPGLLNLGAHDPVSYHQYKVDIRMTDDA